MAFEDDTLRDAADHMVAEGVSRLVVVVRREEPDRLVWPSWAARYCAAHQLPKVRQAAKTTKSVRLAPGAACRGRLCELGTGIDFTPAGR